MTEEHTTEIINTEHQEETTHEITLFAEPLFNIGNFTVTNSLFTGWIAIVIIIFISVAVRASIKKIPKGIQNLFEVIVEGALSLSDQVTNSREISKRAFPITFSIFFFLLINNWLGIIPGIGSIGILADHGGKEVFVPI